MRRRKGTSVLY